MRLGKDYGPWEGHRLAALEYRQGYGSLPYGWDWADSSLLMPDPDPLLRAPVCAGLPNSDAAKAEGGPPLPSLTNPPHPSNPVCRPPFPSLPHALSVIYRAAKKNPNDCIIKTPP